MRIVSAAVILIAFAATGCAQVMQPTPDVKRRLAIGVSRELPTGHDIAAGVYRIPDTSVYVSGYFADAMQTGQYFGALGVIAAEASAKSTAERKTAHVAALCLDVGAATQRILSDQVARADTGRFVPNGPADATLAVVPSLRGNDGAERWKMRYIVSLGEPRPLEGRSGWAAGDGASLRSAVDQALRTAIDLVMRDASGRLPRHTGRDINVQAQWAWSKEMVEYPPRFWTRRPSRTA